MGSNKWIFLRGLARGNGHWGDFPEIFKNKFPGSEIELMEIPGNGTRYLEKTPTDAIEVIQSIRSRSRFYQTKEPFHLCGISLGGMLVLKWAEVYPTDLLSVAAINSSLKELSPFYHRLAPKNYMKLIHALTCKDVKQREALILSMTSNEATRSAAFLESFCAFSEKNPISITNFLRQLKLANSISISANIQTPIKIIASAQDHLVLPICSEKLAKKFKAHPQIEFLIHHSAGHDLPLDEPDWLCNMLIIKKQMRL